MANPNNIPQEAQQLKEELNAPEQTEEGGEKKKPDVASTDFDKEYDMAQKSSTGPGTQTSNDSIVGRDNSNTGDNTASKSRVDNVNSPGDSDPDDYMDMAKDVSAKAKDNQ